jgi:hypothetical protein
MRLTWAVRVLSALIAWAGLASPAFGELYYAKCDGTLTAILVAGAEQFAEHRCSVPWSNATVSELQPDTLIMGCLGDGQSAAVQAQGTGPFNLRCYAPSGDPLPLTVLETAAAFSVGSLPACGQAWTSTLGAGVYRPQCPGAGGVRFPFLPLLRWDLFGVIATGNAMVCTQAAPCPMTLTGPINANVVNTPTVTVGNTPAVSVSNQPTVAVAGTVQTVAPVEVPSMPELVSDLGTAPVQYVAAVAVWAILWALGWQAGKGMG